MAKKSKKVEAIEKQSDVRHIDDVMGEPNRVTRAIQKLRAHMQQRLKDKMTTKAEIEKSRKGLDMQMDEFCKFQELKSVAFLHRVITEAEAQTIYVLLGNQPSVFNGQPFEEKYVLTKMFQEMLAGAIAGQRSVGEATGSSERVDGG